jgi:uncharacterized protein (DUF2249 family)
MIVIDARGMEPPGPFEAVMEALCALKPGQRVLLILEREPLPLYRVLERNGYVHRTTPRADGHFEIEISEGGASV